MRHICTLIIAATLAAFMTSCEGFKPATAIDITSEAVLSYESFKTAHGKVTTVDYASIAKDALDKIKAGQGTMTDSTALDTLSALLKAVQAYDAIQHSTPAPAAFVLPPQEPGPVLHEQAPTGDGCPIGQTQFWRVAVSLPASAAGGN